VSTKKPWFVAGLPGAGKTRLILGLLSLGAKAQKNPVATKPLDVGLLRKNAQEQPLDGELFTPLVQGEPSSGLIFPYVAHEDYPVELAFRRDGVRLDWKMLSQRLQVLLEHYGPVLVETPGGLMTPLEEKRRVIDWLKEAQGVVVYLVGPEPNGLNQLLLELQLLEKSGLEVLMVFNNRYSQTDGDLLFYQWEQAEAAANREAFGMLPFLKNPSPEALGAALEEHMPKLVERFLNG